MEWLAENLITIAALGAFFILASFFRLTWPNRYLLLLGSALVALAGYGAYEVAYGDRNDGSTVIVDLVDIDPDREIPEHIDRLRQPWDSEGPIDWLAADTLVQLSDIAYRPPVFATKEAAALGFSACTPMVAGSMIGYVISEKDVTVLAFRGTDFEESSDWFANAALNPFETENGPIHSGFYDGYDGLSDQLDAVLTNRKVDHLWVTGHSLGGALAVVGAYQLETEGRFHVKGLMTFGQPRVARAPLSSHLDDLLLGRYVRFVNRDDVVPQIPPNYPHCGSLVWFTNEGPRRSKPKRLLMASSSAKTSSVRKKSFSVRSRSTTPGYAVTPELSDEAYRQLMRRLGPVTPLPRNSRKSSKAPQVYAVQSRIIDDHAMREYVLGVRELLQLEVSQTDEEAPVSSD